MDKEKREEHIDKLQAKLKEWNANLEELKNKAKEAESDTKIRYYELIENYENSRSRAEKRLEELKEESGSSWEELKKGADAAWNDLKTAFENAKNEINK